MISKQGDTLQGVTQSQGNIQRKDGVFSGATTFHCHADGSLKYTFVDDTEETFSYVIGDAFPFMAKSVTIVGGTFSIGYD